MKATPSAWITSLPPATLRMEKRGPQCCLNRASHSSHSMCEWTSIAVCMWRPGLLRRNILVAHHLGPARDLRGQQLLGIAWRGGEGLDRLHLHALQHIGTLQCG